MEDILLSEFGQIKKYLWDTDNIEAFYLGVLCQFYIRESEPNTDKES